MATVKEKVITGLSPDDLMTGKIYIVLCASGRIAGQYEHVDVPPSLQGADRQEPAAIPKMAALK